jgi:hypothetical protein
MASVNAATAIEEAEKLLGDEEEGQHVPTRRLAPKSWRQITFQLSPWLLHVLVIAAYSGFFLFSLASTPQDVCYLPTEIRECPGP